MSNWSVILNQGQLLLRRRNHTYDPYSVEFCEVLIAHKQGDSDELWKTLWSYLHQEEEPVGRNVVNQVLATLDVINMWGEARRRRCLRLEGLEENIKAIGILEKGLRELDINPQIYEDQISWYGCNEIEEALPLIKAKKGRILRDLRLAYGRLEYSAELRHSQSTLLSLELRLADEMAKAVVARRQMRAEKLAHLWAKSHKSFPTRWTTSLRRKLEKIS